METYAEYKDSGVDIVELSLPEHWNALKCRFVFEFNKGLTITKENLQETGIPCVNYGEIHSRYGFEVDPLKHDLKCVGPEYLKKNEKSLLNRGDFVFADTSEDIEGAGNFTCLTSDEQTFAGYHTLIARTSSYDSNRFLAYVLTSTSYREQVRKSVKGVKVFSITQAILKNTSVWFPSLLEQTAIARFLDDKVGKVEALVAIKQAQIDLLKERKQILIQDAVTKGLNPDAPMKDSGIDWIGQIPAHWGLKRIKHLLTERNERSETGEEPLLMVSQVHGLVVRADFHSKAEVAASNVGNKIVHESDLVFNKLKAHLGVFFKSNISSPGIVSPDYAVYTPCGDIPDSKYFELLFRHPAYIAQFIIRATGIVEGLIRLYTSELFDIPIAVPPKGEQAEIINFIHDVSKKFEDAITIKENQITKLNEYKVTLINAAVTGKIKVPERYLNKDV